ncbi:MAG: outer membrane beta-barrel protein, partial [Rhodospirillales bacterium]|nr:outer membrane beta-barrel protein [Acetobacter sp.]
TEGVYTYDSGFDTDFYGVAETLAYAINDKVTVAVRGEVVRDSDGFYVAQFGAYDDFTNLERGGIPLDKRTVGGGPNTYVEATLGVQVKPIKYLTVRPEVRFDHSFQSDPFDDGSKQWSVTVGADAIIAF